MSESEFLQPKTPAPTARRLEIKQLRLADAAILRRMGVFSGSLKKVQEAIRRLLASNTHGCYMVAGQLALRPGGELGQAAEDSRPASTENERAGDTQTNLDATGFIALVPDAFLPELGRLTVRATHPAFLPDLLELACRTAFCEQAFLRVESLVPAFPEAVLRPFKDFGFRTEAIVPGALLRAPDRSDHHLLSLPKTLNRYPAVGVVPYKLGVLSVTGTETQVDSVDFHMFGEPVDNPYLRDVFHIWGLLDEKERLRSSKECVRLIRNDGLPAMIGKAVTELQEYMAGERQTFDLKLNLASGSPFQQAVWAALMAIPYGTTETYLDVALKLADGDLKKARAMSRAVGSACGANPVPVVVPCHRVIGRDGRLTGFSGGIENKEYLLEHELFRRR